MSVSWDKIIAREKTKLARQEAAIALTREYITSLEVTRDNEARHASPARKP